MSFEMPIDAVTVIRGRGTLVTGKIRRGAVKVGDPVEITGTGGKSTSSAVILVRMSDRSVGEARAGDTVGVLLGGVKSQDVARGHVLRAR